MTTVSISNPKRGWSEQLVSPTQGQVEMFSRERLRLDKLTDEAVPGPSGSIERLGNLVRAAITAGMLGGHSDPIQVMNMDPQRTLWLARQIDKHLAEVIAVPPE